MKSAMDASASQMNHDSQKKDAHLLWCLGAWSALEAHENNLESTQQLELSLYIAAAQLQLGKSEQAKQLLESVSLNKEQKILVTQLLVSGVYNSLGKAHICAFDHENAARLFNSALNCVLPKTTSDSLINARTIEQYSQLGVPRLADNIQAPEFRPDIEDYFTNSEKHFKREPTLQIALAELYQLSDRYNKAIVHWQNVSGILNADTPQAFYDRLRDAYRSANGFPRGNDEQEALNGDIEKHTLLNEIHKQLEPDFYFEIGVQTGKSLALAKCEALGIDPMPLLAKELASTTSVISTSSDSFFMKQSHLLFNKSIDLSFIDGMHLFEYALRDFINVEKYAKPHSLIIIDDIFPGHPDQAERERCTRAWTGDVWKVKEILEKYRPDLFLLPIDAYPTGLLLISSLNQTNTVLNDNYHSILDHYKNDISVPSEIVQRKNAISGASEVIPAIVNKLKLVRHQQSTNTNLKSILEQLVQQQSKKQVQM